jgi:hypothetical protein
MRSFTHTQFCPLTQRAELHPAHDLGDRYHTRDGLVERWCCGLGPGSIQITRRGSPESLPCYRAADITEQLRALTSARQRHLDEMHWDAEARAQTQLAEA